MHRAFYALGVFVILSFTSSCADKPAPKVSAADVEHPFLLWTKEEAASIKKRIDEDPAAQKQLEFMLSKSIGSRRGKHDHPVLVNLFKYAVLGDEKAGEKEKKALLKFIGKVPEPLTKEFQERAKDSKWARGMSSFSDRHMRDEQTLNTLRYDVLYHELTPEEREGIREAFRGYIQFHLDGHEPWHPDFRYGRMTWLPNMSWPRAIGTHLMAVALKDEALIKAMFESEGGWKYYFDDYVSDGRFYMEEFGKYYSNNGTMLLYCEGLEDLGLGQYGYGYTGKGGANMERYLKMFMDLGFPRTNIPGGMPTYGIIEMGDTPSSSFKLDGLGGVDTIVNGYLPDGTGGDAWFSSSRMNGPLPKFAKPLWWEMGHARFPDAGFDYFLAQMRKPGETVYYPSLYFGLGPIDSTQVKAPEVKSYLARERGFAFLRADESSDYWESASPAVALQFGMYYVHYAHDCFSLLGYQAFNRRIYTHGWGSDGGVTNDSIKAHPRGYVGKHPWFDTVRGHASGVVVDNLKAMPIASGENGLENHEIREDLTGFAKFVAGRVKPKEMTDTKWVKNEETGETDVVKVKNVRGIYPDIDMERALILTDEYLFDATWLKSGTDRQMDWHVNGAGSLLQDSKLKWTPTKELNGSKLYRSLDDPEMKTTFDVPEGNDLTEVVKAGPGKERWTATILQDSTVEDLASTKLGPEWYDEKIGVKVHMLPSSETTLFSGRPPFGGKKRKKLSFPEIGGTTLMARRVTNETVFAAVHEPFRGGVEKAPLNGVQSLSKGPDVAAVRIEAADGSFTDYAMIALGDSVGEPRSIDQEKESIRFQSHAWIRVTEKDVVAIGDIQQLSIAVKGSPSLWINGEKVTAKIEAGVLTYQTK